MQCSHALQRLLSLITVFSLLLSPVSSAFPPPVAHAAASDPPSRVTLTNGLTLETATTFRTTVRLSHPQQLKQVIQTGATLLVVEGLRLGRLDLTAQTFGVSETPKVFPAAEYPLVVTLLVTDKQLEAIARMQLMPERTDSVASLLRANHLLGSNDPSTTLRAGFSRQVATTLALSAIASGIGVDSDGDGLTDTEEGWWCTDPLNPDSDNDGISDGVEVQQAKDWLANRRSSYPASGPPYKGWPMVNGDPAYNPQCIDRDQDVVPDAAETWVLGLNPNRESTDGDKFDDGQELFGLTKPGWGLLPRTEDIAYITSNMPAWVKAPGNHPMVAAFPVPEVSVVAGSWHVDRVTTITTQQGQMTQAAKTYGSSVTRGTSDSIANTVTWNNWEEVSQAVSQPLNSATLLSPDGVSTPNKNWWEFGFGTALFAGGAAAPAALGVLGAAGVAAGATTGILGAAAACVVSVICAVGVGVGAAVIGLVGTKLMDRGWDDNTNKDTLQNANPVNIYNSSTSVANARADASAQASAVVNNNINFEGLANSVDGVSYAINQQGALLAQGLHDVAYAIDRPRLTETKTSGHSWGGAQTTTHTELEEHTLSESQAFTTGENWSTAWAVDSSHAANLSFNFTIKNTGTEYAREITGVIFNVYLGDDKLPFVSYAVNQTFQNVFPDQSFTLSSSPTVLPLTLDQMRRIDLGEHLTVVLANFSYGVDQLFYQNATQGGVTIFTEGGADDASETVDSYVIPTWGTESVQTVLARYFPMGLDSDGLVNSLSTPTFVNNVPTWHEHFLSDIAWWNVYLSQSDAGNTELRDLPAQANSALFFRFNRDSDRDGYPDRTELKYGTDPHNPASHPQPELVAGYTSSRSGNVVTVKLALENAGTFDAHHVSAVMYSPDGTTTIGNNTVGGNGRVRPGHHVAVGSLIKPPSLALWGGSTAKPYSGGDYGGSVDRTYTFNVSTPGVVGSSTTAMTWNDGMGITGTLNLGASYHAPLPLDVSQGLQVGFNSGTIAAGASFTVTALTPRDTFTYTVNTDPYTKPVVVVSYSDPQGAHRFITPIEVPSLAASLVPTYTGKMLQGVGLQIATTGAVITSGMNLAVSAANLTTNFVFNSPDAAGVQGAHLYVDFVSNGALVLHLPYTLTLPAGPTVYAVSWVTTDFSQTYNVNNDNILIAHWTDSEGNIIDSAARPLNTFANDPVPAFAMANGDTTWNFGTVTQGQVLTKRLTFANTGFTDLQTYLSDRIAGAPKSPWVAFTDGNYVRKTALQGNYLWEATSGGVVVRDLTNGTYVKFTTADSRLADNDVYSVFIDAGGRKWFGTYSGVNVLNDNGTPLDKSDDTWITFTTADGLAGNPVYQIVVDNAGRKWLVSDLGVNVFDDGGTPFNKADDQWQTFNRTDVGCVSSAGRAIAIDNAGLKWIGCGWDGLSVLDDKGTPFNKSDDQWQHFSSADGMGSTLISSIAIDGAGRKWLASWSSPGGVMVLNDNGTPFNKADDQWQYFSSSDSGLVNNGVQSVVIDGSGYKWFGTNTGVSVLNDNGTPFNKGDDTWITFSTTDGLAASRANYILIDGSGRKWIATEGGGVSRLNDNGTPFNKSDDQWQTLATADGLAANRIASLRIDGAGLKWIGTYGGGLSLLDDNGTLSNKADDQWQIFTSADGLPSDIVYAIAIDGAGRKWFAGHGYQVSVLNDNGTPFNKSDDQWQTFTTADGLASITNRIVIDGASRKWFGTWSGVSVLNDNGTPFNKADDQWITFNTADGLANNFVSALVIDGAGRKWIGTDGGVSVLNDNNTPFNKADDQWVTFTTSDGLVSNYVGAIAIDSAGRKWFGTGFATHSSGSGVSVLDDNGTPFNKADDQWQSFTTADGLTGSSVYDIFIDNLGRKWFETDRGISVLDDNGTPFNKADDHWTTYTASDGLTNNSVNVLIVDGANNKWFGTEGGVSVLPAGSAPSPISMLSTLASRLQPADTATYTVTVDTRTLPAGPYSRTLTIRTSDPARPLATLLVTGTINALSSAANAFDIANRPWDKRVLVYGNVAQYTPVDFTENIQPDTASIEPCKVFDASGATLKGIGKYCADFGGGVGTGQLFGDGADGPLTLSPGQAFDINTISALSSSANAGDTSVNVVWVCGFRPPREVILHQTQGANAGIWESNYVISSTQVINSCNGTLYLQRPLVNSYTQGGNSRAQVIEVPHYTDVTVPNGATLLTLPWDGNRGGFLAFRANGTVIISGTINASNSGFRGGAGTNAQNNGDQNVANWGAKGEGTASGSIRTKDGYPNANGGGGGCQGNYGGGGGGNRTSNGYNGCAWNGDTAGNEVLTIATFGGGGGGGGQDWPGGTGGGTGGTGGGLVIIIARTIVVSGTIAANGGNGSNYYCTTSCGNAAGGGGAGAGGSILLRSQNIALGENLVSASGGTGGLGQNPADPAGHGGAGGDGRIHIEYCNTLTGTTNPPASAQKLNCYIAAKTTASNVRFTVPDVVTGGQNYVMQFGRHFAFGVDGGTLVTPTRLVAQTYSSATMDALITNIGGGGATQIRVDVGNQMIYSQTQTITQPTTINLPNFANAINQYIASQSGGSTVDVPFRVTIDRQVDVNLTNLALASGTGTDVTLSATDIAFGALNPTEGASVPVTATLHNNGSADSGGLTAAFYATLPGFGPWYVGSAYVPNIVAGGTATASILWNTFGFTGTTPLRVVADPFNRVAETNENNNQVTATLTILSRPDLRITSVSLSNPEPVVGETVTATLVMRNFGQTGAPSSVLALYNGNPDSGGASLGVQTVSSLSAGNTITLTFTWTPTATGLVRLFARADRDRQVNESDRSNNDAWLDVYVGFRGPLLLDSGNGASDLAYTTARGYGVVDEGQPDELGNCGSAPEQTFRRDPAGRVVYRFDNLLPGHFYHLDLTLNLCGASGRQEFVKVDGSLVAGPEDLGDGKVHRLSLRLDPALYADRTISVSVETTGLGGAIVNEVNLYDVDYRYSDSGGPNDPPYTPSRGYGYLNGTPYTQRGTLPFQSLRENQSGNSVSYRYDRLDPNKRYVVNLTFWQATGATVIEKVQIDGVDTGTTLNLQSGVLYSTTINVPGPYYADGSIVVTVVRTNASTSPLVNEIALEEATLMRDSTCAAPVTPNFTNMYGNVLINGQPAPNGTLVQAISPRGDTVGCYVVNSAGLYGFMPVYGEDPSANPPIPGMRNGEPIAVRVNGAPAVLTPLLYWRNDLSIHRVDLNSGSTEGQSILFVPGWNLFSMRVEPPAPLVAQVLGSVNGRYDRVLGETGAYVPTLPDAFNTLKELHSGLSYYVRITGTTSVNALVEGLPRAVDSPIPLHQGWNWIGYLPTTTLPITVALSSIEGKYQRVLGIDKAYDPSLPLFSTLKEMKSGEGYLIYVTQAVNLTYPVTTGAASATLPARANACDVSPTPFLTLVYGEVRINGQPAPIGTQVEVLTPRGEVAGCFVTSSQGLYGLMYVYGADTTASPVIPGFFDGEVLTFRINGAPATASTAQVWHDDRTPHLINLNATLNNMWLPIIQR